MPEPSSVLSTAKSLSEIKLETPFMLASSLLGWLGLLTLYGGAGQTPLSMVGGITTWLGWHGPEGWLSAVHSWLTAPDRVAAIGFIFFLSMTFGIASTKYGQHRSGFFGLLGFAGLLEMGLDWWSLGALAIAALVIVLTGRLSDDGVSDHASLTAVYLMLAALHPLLVLLNVFMGEKPARATKTAESS